MSHAANMTLPLREARQPRPRLHLPVYNPPQGKPRRRAAEKRQGRRSRSQKLRLPSPDQARPPPNPSIVEAASLAAGRPCCETSPSATGVRLRAKTSLADEQRRATATTALSRVPAFHPSAWVREHSQVRDDVEGHAHGGHLVEGIRSARQPHAVELQARQHRRPPQGAPLAVPARPRSRSAQVRATGVGVGVGARAPGPHNSSHPSSRGTKKRSMFLWLILPLPSLRNVQTDSFTLELPLTLPSWPGE